MSYDLNFYKKSNDSISKSDIESYLSNLPNVISENDSQWFYENKETGSYCSFEYYEFGGSEDDDEKECFEGFEDTGFTFNINFIRPQFFGEECFPIVDKLVEDLNLFIVNPQGEEKPQKYGKGLLEKQWGESNLKLSKSNFKEWGLSYLEIEKSNYSWKFCLNRISLQKKLGENYFVPGIFYIKKKDSDVVETICVWPEHIPYVLPKVDFIYIQKNVQKLFKTKKEEGLIKYSDLVSKLGKCFNEEEDYKIIHPYESRKISKKFNDLPLIGNIEQYGEGISVDKIVNTMGED